MEAFHAMNEAPWRAGLLRATTTCATFYARRVPNWIAIGNRIWGTQAETGPKTGLSVPDDLMQSARREIELRGEYTRRVIGEFAECSYEAPASLVLTECTAAAVELIRRGCRDVAKDIE